MFEYLNHSWIGLLLIVGCALVIAWPLCKLFNPDLSDNSWFF